MSVSNFPRALANVLQDEGGNDDDPHDHGGRTSRGITQREYDAWRRSHGEGAKDVWTANDDEIKDIYKAQYWDPWCDDFPVGIDYLYFDMAVNAGPHRATVLLQRALGVRDDGHIGIITKDAITKGDPKSLIASYSTAKRLFYRGLHQPRFLKGWLNRTAHVETVALKMVGA